MLLVHLTVLLFVFSGNTVAFKFNVCPAKPLLNVYSFLSKLIFVAFKSTVTVAYNFLTTLSEYFKFTVTCVVPLFTGVIYPTFPDFDTVATLGSATSYVAVTKGLSVLSNSIFVLFAPNDTSFTIYFVFFYFFVYCTN